MSGSKLTGTVPTQADPVPTWKLKKSLTFPAVCYCACFTPDGRWLLTGCEDGIVRFHNWEQQMSGDQMGLDSMSTTKGWERYMPGTHPKEAAGKDGAFKYSNIPSTPGLPR